LQWCCDIVSVQAVNGRGIRFFSQHLLKYLEYELLNKLGSLQCGTNIDEETVEKSSTSIGVEASAAIENE
jgi:hypothetical protein